MNFEPLLAALRTLPVQSSTLTIEERRRLNDCVRFGWAEYAVDGVYQLTARGRLALADETTS